MDSRHPGAKPESRRTGSIAVPQTQRTVRRYPKPPALLKRFLLLLLKPEAWPAAAQYPFWVTLMPLVLSVVLAAAAVGVGGSAQFMKRLDYFAKSYDQKYPAMQLNGDGVLSLPSSATQPFDFSQNGNPFVVDTTGKTSFDAVKGDTATLITDRNVYVRVLGNELSPQPIAEVPPYSLFVPAKGEVNTFDSAHIRNWTAANRTAVAWGAGLLAFVLKGMGESLWILVTLFLVHPVVMVGAAVGEKPLALPKRAAYRIVAALLVPVVLFGGVMQGAGYSADSVVGSERAFIFWFFATAAVAFWAGKMAKRMYNPKAGSRPH